MKRLDFLKALFVAPVIGKALIETKPVENSYKSGKVILNDIYTINRETGNRTITINGNTQYLKNNPSFNIGDDIINVNGSDLSISVSKRTNRNNSEFI